jgi:hypothetical protein
LLGIPCSRLLLYCLLLFHRFLFSHLLRLQVGLLRSSLLSLQLWRQLTGHLAAPKVAAGRPRWRPHALLRH